jgi:molybdopterin molybdotransferase
VLSYEEALAAVLAHCSPLPSERLPLTQASGCFLAEPLIAAADLPRFNCSAVDGYGLRVADITDATADCPVQLPVSQVLHAGESYDVELQPGEAVKLMTGAMVPPGVETVVMREETVEQAGAVLIKRAVPSGANIRLSGGDCRAGDVLAAASACLTPPLMALHAAQGLADAAVHGLPSIALLTTGDELVAPGSALSAGQIYDSNSAALTAAVQQLGLQLAQATCCGDELCRISEALASHTRWAHVVLSAGGVSVGDKDLIRDACAALGMQIVFHGVAVKPGKPVLFARFRRGDGSRGLFFGLPGNPVGALLSFDRLVRPAILRLMGAAQATQTSFTAKLSTDLFKRKGRLEFVRGQAVQGATGIEVTPIAARDSHMLVGLVDANCLILFPQESDKLAAGASVAIEWLYWA